MPLFVYLMFRPHNIDWVKAACITALLCAFAYVPQFRNFQAFFAGKQTVDIPTPTDLKVQYKLWFREEIWEGLR